MEPGRPELFIEKNTLGAGPGRPRLARRYTRPRRSGAANVRARACARPTPILIKRNFTRPYLLPFRRAAPRQAVQERQEGEKEDGQDQGAVNGVATGTAPNQAHVVAGGKRQPRVEKQGFHLRH